MSNNHKKWWITIKGHVIAIAKLQVLLLLKDACMWPATATVCYCLLNKWKSFQTNTFVLASSGNAVGCLQVKTPCSTTRWNAAFYTKLAWIHLNRVHNTRETSVQRELHAMVPRRQFNKLFTLKQIVGNSWDFSVKS